MMEKGIFLSTMVVFSLLTLLDGSRNPVIALGFSAAFCLLLALRSLVPNPSARRDDRRLRIVLVACIPLGAWMIMTVIQASGLAIASEDPYRSWVAFYRGCGYVAAWLLLVTLIHSPGRLAAVAGVIMLVAVFQTLFGMANFYSGDAVFGWAPTHYAFHRVTGTYVNRNFFASLLAMSAGFSLVWLMTRHPRNANGADQPGRPWRPSPLRAGAAMVLLLLLSGILLSGSRGAMLAFAGSLVMLVVVILPMRRIRLSGWLVGSTAIAAIILFGTGLMRFRFGGIGPDMADRLEQWRTTLAMVSERPWFGHGPGSYETVFRNRQSGELGPLTYNHAHNDYLQLLLEQGVVGLALAAAAVSFLVAVALYRAFTGRSLRRKRWVLSCLFGISAIFLHALVDFPLQVPANVWLCMALLAMMTSACSISFGPRENPKRLLRNGRGES